MKCGICIPIWSIEFRSMLATCSLTACVRKRRALRGLAERRGGAASVLGPVEGDGETGAFALSWGKGGTRFLWPCLQKGQVDERLQQHQLPAVAKQGTWLNCSYSLLAALRESKTPLPSLLAGVPLGGQVALAPDSAAPPVSPCWGRHPPVLLLSPG